MSESTSSPDQFVPPTPESLREFDEATEHLVGLSEQLGRVSFTQRRYASPGLYTSDEKNRVGIECEVSSSHQPGESDERKSHLSVSVMRWPDRDPQEKIHMMPPVVRSMEDGKDTTPTGMEAMDDIQYAFALSDLQQDLPPDTRGWVNRVLAEVARPDTPGFREIVVHDLLDQAQALELENVPVFEFSIKAANLTCMNGSQVGFEIVEGNDTYWKKQNAQDPPTKPVKVQVLTEDGRDFRYSEFHDGRKHVTVTLPDYGATVAEGPQDVDTSSMTMHLMAAELNAALASGVKES